jgi:hypothetical protein
MCNACGFHCCAYDAFSGCGCDSCDETECWSDDDGPDLDDNNDRHVQGLSSIIVGTTQNRVSGQSDGILVGSSDMVVTPFAGIASRQFPAIRSTATRSPKDRHDEADSSRRCCKSPDQDRSAT